MNVTLPNGKVIPNVPEGTSKEEIKRVAILNNLATEEDFVMAGTATDVGADVSPDVTVSTGSQDPNQVQDTGVFDKLGEAYKQRFEKVKKERVKFEAGEISFPELAATAVGQDVGMFIDTVGIPLMEGLSEAIPDFVKSGAEDLFNEFVQTDTGKEAMEAIGGGFDAYKEFAERNPRVATQLENIFNVGSVLIPLKKPKGGDKKGFFKRKGDKLIKVGDSKYEQKIFGAFEDLGKVDNIKRTIDGKIDLKKLSPMEQKAINSLKGTKGFDYGHNAWANINAVNKSIDEITEQVAKQLKNTRGTPLNIKSVVDDFTENSLRLLDDTIEPEKLGKALADVEAKMGAVIAKHSKGGRIDSEGMWKARKELDGWFNDQVKGEGFETRGSMSKAIYAARNAMNKELKARNPGLSNKMDKQSGLLYAQEGVAGLAAQEAKATFGNLIRMFEKIGFKGRALSVLLSGLGAGAGGALAFTTNAAAMAGIIATGMLTTTLVRKGRQTMGKVLNRKKVGELMGMFDEGIQKAKKIKDTQLVKELRATRASLLTLAKDTGVFDEPKEGQQITPEEQVAP
jgi:Skp family chaperone for outer membrane proteins